MPSTQPRKKSNAIWWVLGIVAVLAVIGTGLVVMLLALASMGTNQNDNTNTNTNSRVANRNRNTNTNTNTASETNTNNNADAELPSSVTDDFSGEKWRAGNFQYGDIWYADDQYHMRSKEKTYLVMYAPSAEYGTENASVSVTARSVDASPTSGYGLIVHGEKKDNQLEDYALLVYTGSEPQYEVVMHQGGNQTTLVPWTKTAVLRSGTSPNQLEVRTKGDELSFYVNGHFLTRITDKENFKRGVAGLYTSESQEVVFDDLEIRR